MTVSADATNYKNGSKPTYMPPGEYTFTIEMRTPAVDQIAEVVVQTTIKWTLVDPCEGKSITLGSISPSSRDYIITDTAKTVALTEATLAPSLTLERDLLDYCGLDYSLVASPFQYLFCIQYTNPLDFEFSIFCDSAQI